MDHFIAMGVGGVIGLIILMLVYQVLALRIVVPTNMVHIVQSSKYTTPFGKGQDAGNTYYKWPSWIPIFGVVVAQFPESVFDIYLDKYEAYDMGRLPFLVDIKAFFRVDDSTTAAQRVASFHELREQLTAVVQGAVRRILGTNNLEHIMQDRSKLAAEFTEEVNSQLTEWGVKTVKSIEFMNIQDKHDSHVIENIMAKEKSRIDKESRIIVAANQQEAQMREIDAKRTIDVQRQDAEQQIGIRTAEKLKTVGIAEEQAKQQVQVEAKTTAERDLDVAKVQQVRSADIAKEVAVVHAQQESEVTIVKAEASKKAMVISAEAQKTNAILNAEANKQTTQLVAEGALAAAKNEATGIEAVGKAKAAAEAALLMAPVTAQITLAEKIGQDESYQKYLVTIRQVEASQAVGTAMANAMVGADMKIIANGGDIQSGAANLMDMFTTTKGGTGVASMLAAMSATPEGAAMVNRVVGAVSGKTEIAG